jgi:hypothetical protein
VSEIFSVLKLHFTGFKICAEIVKESNEKTNAGNIFFMCAKIMA